MMNDDYGRPRSINGEISGEAAAAGLGLGIGLLSLLLSGILFLITRFDIVCSSVLALLVYLLTYKNGWDTKVYIIGALVIIAVSMLLQHFVKVFRILYGIFGCVIASLLGPILIGYDSSAKMYMLMAVSFGVTALWGFLSWKYIASRKE